MARLKSTINPQSNIPLLQLIIPYYFLLIAQAHPFGRIDSVTENQQAVMKM